MDRKQMITWRSMAAFLVLMLLSMTLPMPSFGDAGVESFWNTAYEADYYVKVSASDGGANLRNGAGVEYSTIISGMMPNGTVLHITSVAAADNGKKWGLTEYQGSQGWVALSQTTPTDAPSQDHSSDNTNASKDAENTTQENSSAGTLTAAATVVDYYVKVAAPDGGVNFRYGPGTAYAKIISHMIPNGTQLHISGEGRASNGKTWGLAEYNGQLGWIFLGQTEKISSGLTRQSQTTQPAQTSQPSQAAQPAQTAPPVQNDETEEDLSESQDSTEQPAAEETDDPDSSDATDDGTLTIRTDTLLKAAMVLIAILLILLFLTIVLLTRKRNRPEGEQNGPEMRNNSRDRRNGYDHDQTYGGRDYRDPWNRR